MSDVEVVVCILKGMAFLGCASLMYHLLGEKKANKFLALLIAGFMFITYAKSLSERIAANNEAAANAIQREVLTALQDVSADSDEVNDIVGEEDDIEYEGEDNNVGEETGTYLLYLETPDTSTYTDAVGVTMCWSPSIAISDYMAYIFGISELGEEYSFKRRIYPANNTTNHTEYISYSLFYPDSRPDKYFFKGLLEEDFDHDNMPDWWEEEYGFDTTTNDAGIDSDGDGLSNLQEYLIGTHPKCNDSDGDGILDGVEIDLGNNPSVKDADKDSDGDGMPDVVEREMGIISFGSDSDGDGIPDGLEWAVGLSPTNCYTTVGIADIDAIRTIPLGGVSLEDIGEEHILYSLDGDMVEEGGFEIIGILDAKVDFGTQTLASSATVYGVSWPGGSTNFTNYADIAFSSEDEGTNSVFDVTISNSTFKAAKTGWYGFQFAVDDTMSFSLDDEVVATAQWSYDNDEGIGDVGWVLLKENEEREMKFSIHNNGGPGKLEILKFGEFRAIEAPAVNVWFEAAEIVYREDDGETIEPPGVDEYTRVYIEATGGDFGADLYANFSEEGCLSYIMFDDITEPISIAAGTTKRFEGIYRATDIPSSSVARSLDGFDSSQLYLSVETHEKRTNRTYNQDASITIRKAPLKKRLGIQILSDERVVNDKYVYISATPSMPDLRIKMYPENLSGTVSCTARIEYERKGMSQAHQYVHTMNANGEWILNNDLNGTILGGKLTVSCVYDSKTYTSLAYIRGTNPSAAEVEVALSSGPWYLIPMARREAGAQGRAKYCQFNEVGKLGPKPDDYKACPNWGRPSGWGIMQLDNPPPSDEALWNWRINIAEGISHVQNTCVRDAENWMRRQIRQQQQEDPTNIVQNVIFEIEGVQFQEGTAKTPTDICAIIRYNGATVWPVYWSNEESRWKLNEEALGYLKNILRRINQ